MIIVYHCSSASLLPRMVLVINYKRGAGSFKEINQREYPLSLPIRRLVLTQNRRTG